ncbi:MAG: helix-turn-helix transcriptional regulator [Alistipes sp.]
MEGDQILVDFGLNIQRLRKARGLSQEKLAELAGLHRTYIGMIERAEKNLTLLNIVKIAQALKVSVATLLTFNK